MGSETTNTGSSSDGLSQGPQKMLHLIGRTTGPTRRSTKGQWTAEEDEILRKAVQRFKGKNWKKIAECCKDRTDVQCLHRWQKVLNPELVKGPWSKEEDDIIVRLVEQYGAKKWSTIAQHLPGRIGKQCRERWHNHLNPAINKDAWTQEEELMLIRAHQVYGNKWAELTKFLPGRTDNAIKNHWNSSVKKKIDSYMASGLLTQFQDLPCVSHTNQSTPTSSRTQQVSGDGCSRKDVPENEEISECIQASTFVRCSQSNNENQPADMAKAIVVYTGNETHENQPTDMAQAMVVYTGDEYKINTSVLHNEDDPQPAENLNHGNDPNPNPTLPSELDGPSNFIEQSCAHGWPSSDRGRLSSNEIQLDLSREPEFIHCIDFDQNPEAVTDPTQSAVGFSVSDMAAQLPFNSESRQCNGVSVKNEEFPELADAGPFYINDSRGQESQDRRDEVIDRLEFVPSVDFVSEQLHGTQIHPPVDETLQAQQPELGALSYEPPRFPSMDFPFFSCDLIQSGGDLEHEFSPLGIRQLMMTSMNCFSPCRLWDSPSHDGSPEAVLKSAAKSFTCTPSILKKRNRDLLSPLSEKRCGKKVDRVSFFNSAKDSSSRDGDSGQVIEDKENLNPVDEISQKEGGKCRTIKVQQSPRVLVEHNLDDMFFSPDKLATKSDTPKGPYVKTPKDQVTPSQSLISPHTVSGKRNKAGSRFTASIQSAPLETSVENAANDTLVENSGLFGGTPLKKSLESPSAWKSPWLSFLPGPRVDTDISIEDIGYFTPAERSYDALGLMKQLSEHTASAYANAQEILGDETADSILKKRFSEKGEKSRQESNVLSERRVLDFSECGSPRKGSSGISFSSPSSYLLKGCR